MGMEDHDMSAEKRSADVSERRNRRRNALRYVALSQGRITNRPLAVCFKPCILRNCYVGLKGWLNMTSGDGLATRDVNMLLPRACHGPLLACTLDSSPCIDLAEMAPGPAKMVPDAGESASLNQR